MKEMIYQKERLEKPEILDTGVIDGRTYYILNLGTHPTAYVSITGEEYSKCSSRDDYNIAVHYGFTFLDRLDDIDTSHRFLGWDYMHCCDYIGWYEDSKSLFYKQRKDLKKWTTEEILEEVKYAIKQLNNGKFVKHEYYTFEYNED